MGRDNHTSAQPRQNRNDDAVGDPGDGLRRSATTGSAGIAAKE